MKRIASGYHAPISLRLDLWVERARSRNDAPRWIRNVVAFPDKIRSHGKGYVRDRRMARGDGVVDERKTSQSCPSRYHRTGHRARASSRAPRHHHHAARSLVRVDPRVDPQQPDQSESVCTPRRIRARLWHTRVETHDGATRKDVLWPRPASVERFCPLGVLNATTLASVAIGKTCTPPTEPIGHRVERLEHKAIGPSYRTSPLRSPA